MFYLLQIVFILSVSIFVNIPGFIYSVFNYIFYVNNTTNVVDNNYYITVFLDKFLCCNCNLTGESITFLQTQIKFSKYTRFLSRQKISLLGFFSRKQDKYLRLFLCFLVFDSFLKFLN